MDTPTIAISRAIAASAGPSGIRRTFRTRLARGYLTRPEHPTSHFCVYFAAYDPAASSVFIGHHKKSGLWLFNGGHMEPNETPYQSVMREIREEWGIDPNAVTIATPDILTLTRIINPNRQVCRWHYDLWYLLPVSTKTFSPDPTRLSTEFITWGWKSYTEARMLFGDPNSATALRVIETRP